MMRIGSSPEDFMDCFSEFYNQLKNPEAYSFFKVREFEAVESAKGLQAYWDVSTPSEKQQLKDFEVSIDTIESLRKTDESANTTEKDSVSGNVSEDDAGKSGRAYKSCDW